MNNIKQLVWALKCSIAGLEYRFASETISLDGTTYLGGLTLEPVSVVWSDNPMAVYVASGVDWANVARVVGGLSGGYAELLLVYVFEDGAKKVTTFLRGNIDSVTIGPVGQKMTLNIGPSQGIKEFPPASAEISTRTQPDNCQAYLDWMALAVGGSIADFPLTDWALIWYVYNNQGPAYFIGTDADYLFDWPFSASSSFENFQAQKQFLNDYGDGTGTYYPVLIGYPQNLPATLVQGKIVGTFEGKTTIGPAIYAVCLGTINESSVFDVAVARNGEFSSAFSGIAQAVYDFDNAAGSGLVLGLTDLTGAAYSGFYFTRDLDNTIQSITIKFDPNEPTPVIYKDRGLRGLSDVFDWTLTTWTDLTVDIGLNAVDAPILNQIKVDTYVNTPTNAMTWLMELLEPCPVRMVRGPAGVALRYIPYRGDGSDLSPVAHILADSNFVRVTQINTREDIANKLAVVQYGANVSGTTTKSEAKTFDSRSGVFVTVDPDPTFSATIFNSDLSLLPTHKSIEIAWLQDTSAARMLAEYQASRLAKQSTIQYQGPVKFAFLCPGDVVELTDTPLLLDRVKAVVTDLVVDIANVTLTLELLDWRGDH